MTGALSSPLHTESENLNVLMAVESGSSILEVNVDGSCVNTRRIIPHQGISMTERKKSGIISRVTRLPISPI